MKIWHIQMHLPQGRNGRNIDSVKMLKEKPPIIGTGEWDDFQCRNFKNFKNKGLSKGDLVLVRKGKKPIALCQPIDDIAFEDKNLTNKYINQIFRKVNILEFYKGKENFLQNQGTLQNLTDTKTDSYKFILKWYSQYLAKQKMKKLSSILKHKSQFIFQGPPGTGKTYTAKELAYQFITNSPLPTDGNERKKQLKELQDSGQFKIIQFHPAYTYEDFVRGITAKPNENGEGIIYEAENKTLGLFAKKALENYTDSKKTSDTLSKEIWIEKEFKNFVLNIVDRLEKEDIELTKKVDLVNIDPDAFRYKGKNGWSKNGNRMLFKDIKQAYLDDNKERQDIVQNKNLSSLANWHATYFLEVLKIFENYLKKNKSSFEINEENKVSLKNYVLIIDEINRANLPSVLGELIYALEYRDEEVDSMYEVGGSQKILLPSNLFIIGTMNTADRSVGHIDYAIRRRFAFVDVLPNNEVVHPIAHRLFKKVSEFFIQDFDQIDWSKPKPKKSKFLVGDFRPRMYGLAIVILFQPRRVMLRLKKSLN